MVQRVLSSLPGGHRINYWMQLASKSHSQAIIDARIPNLLEFHEKIQAVRPFSEMRILEISAGWNAINALIFSLLGAKEVIATDYVRHVRLREMIKVLKAARKEASRIAAIRNSPADTVYQEIDRLLETHAEDQLFSAARIKYLAPADATRLGLPDGELDMVYSFGVLAHFPEEQLEPLAKETRRVLKPHGLVAHSMGLQDPYTRYRGGEMTNFLRYSDRTWKFISSGMLYNNRWRASQHTQLYTKLGAKIILADRKFRPEDLPRVKEMQLAKRFEGLSPEDLSTHAYQLICQF